jgi:palmitoyl transferase
MNWSSGALRAGACAWLAAGVMGHAAAQTTTGAPVASATPVAKPAEAEASRGFFDPVPEAERKWVDCNYETKWLATQCRGFKAAWYDRKPLVLVSGYAWHDPNTYDEDNLEAFNSAAWGGGFGFGRFDEATGDNYSWYVLSFKDSNSNLTNMIGFGWVTYWPEKADIAVGLGYTVFIMQRPDIYNGIPFPAALPLASIKLGNAEILGTFIPKLDAGINHGNVGYLFGRYQF